MPAVTTQIRSRAPAMAADERRSAIVAATLPLLLAHGPAVSTRHIAEAAGIAEGEIDRAVAEIRKIRATKAWKQHEAVTRTVT